MMISTKSKIIRVLLTVTLISLFIGFAMAFTACDQPNNQGESEPPAQSVVEVSVNGAFTGEVTDADIMENLTVELVDPSGTRTAVEYEVKSSRISDDGTHLEIVITVQGVDKDVLAEYVTVKEVTVRDDLKPLYDMLKAEGDKSFTAVLTCATKDGQGTKKLTYKATVNVLAEGGIEFAIDQVDGDTDTLLFSYKDSKIYFDGNVINLTDIEPKLIELLSQLMTYEETEEIIDEIAGEGAEIETIDTDKLFDTFIAFSNALDTMDEFADNPFLSLFDITFTNTDGVYLLEMNAKSIFAYIPELLPAISIGDYDVDYNELFVKLDELLGGFLTSDSVKLNAMFEVNQCEVILGLKLTDIASEKDYSISVAVAVADSKSEITMPVIEDDELQDASINAVINLPIKDANIDCDIVLHSFEAFNIVGKDVITADINYNGEKAGNIVINGSYIYIDLTKLLTELTGQEINAKFYEEYKIDGEPATLTEIVTLKVKDLVKGLINMIMGGQSDEEQHGDNAYVVAEFVEGSNLFVIGTTEDQLKEELYVYLVTGVYDSTEITEYTVVGFDGSVSGNFNIEIQTANGSAYLDIVIYNPENKSVTGVEAKSYITGTEYVTTAEAGINASDVTCDGYAYFTDGVANWKEVVAVNIVKVNSVDVTEETEFSQSGDYEVTFGYTLNDVQVTFDAVIRVCNPANPLPIALSVDSYVYVSEDATEDDLRSSLIVEVLYDNFDYSDPISDYEFVNGFTYGDPYVTIKYGDISAVVEIRYYDEDPSGVEPAVEEETDYNEMIMTYAKFLRFFVMGEEDNLQAILTNSYASLMNIIAENQDTFASIIKTEETNDGTITTFTLSSEEDVDVLDIVNLFVGIPVGEDYMDITEGMVVLLASMVADINVDDLQAIVNEYFGKEVGEFIQNIYITVETKNDDNSFVKVSLTDGENEYCSFEVSGKLIDRQENVVLTEDDTNDALPMSEFMGVMKDAYDLIKVVG